MQPILRPPDTVSSLRVRDAAQEPTHAANVGDGLRHDFIDAISRDGHMEKLDTETKTLWLVAHEKSDPMKLTMREIEHQRAYAELERMLRKQRDRGLHVDPVDPHPKPDIRYQVFNDNGWIATYWLALDVSDDDGMLTRIGTPVTQRPTHVRIPLSR